MKILETIGKDRVCCLQAYEAVFLASSKVPVPDVLLEEIFEQGPIDIRAAEDGYRFDLVVTNPKNVKWLEEQAWIVDYTRYGHMSSVELTRVAEQIKRDFEKEVEAYNRGSRLHRDTYYSKMGECIAQKRHEVKSLELLAKFADKKVEFAFPDEIYKEFRQGPIGRFFSRAFDWVRTSFCKVANAP